MQKDSLGKQHARNRWKRYGLAGQLRSARLALTNGLRLTWITVDTRVALHEANEAFAKFSAAYTADCKRMDKKEKEIRDGSL